MRQQQLYLHKNINFQKYVTSYSSLIILNLTNCQVTSFRQIPYFQELKILYLDNNLIETFLYLNIYKKLKKLSLNNNPILNNIKHSRIIQFLVNAFPELQYFNDVQLQYNLMHNSNIDYNLIIQLLTHSYAYAPNQNPLYQGDILNEHDYKHYLIFNDKMYDNMKYVPLQFCDKNIIIQISKTKREYSLLGYVQQQRYGQIYSNVVCAPTQLNDILKVEFLYDINKIKSVQIVRWVQNNKYNDDITQLLQQYPDDDKLLIGYRISDNDLYLDDFQVQVINLNSEVLTIFKSEQQFIHSGCNDIKFSLYAQAINNVLYISVVYNTDDINRFNNKSTHHDLIQMNFEYKINDEVFKNTGDYILYHLDEYYMDKQFVITANVSGILYNKSQDRTILLDKLCTIKQVIDGQQMHDQIYNHLNQKQNILFVGQTIEQHENANYQVEYYYIEPKQLQMLIKYHKNNVYEALTQEYVYHKIDNYYVGTYKNDNNMKVVLNHYAYIESETNLTITDLIHHCMIVQIVNHEQNTLQFSPFLIESQNKIQLINNQICLKDLHDDNIFMIIFELSQPPGEFIIKLNNNKTNYQLKIQNNYYISYDEICMFLFSKHYSESMYDKMIAHFSMYCSSNVCQIEIHNFTNSCTLEGDISIYLCLQIHNLEEQPAIQQTIVLTKYEEVLTLYDASEFSSTQFNLIYNSDKSQSNFLDKIKGQNSVSRQLHIVFSQEFLKNIDINDQYGFFYVIKEAENEQMIIEEISSYLNEKKWSENLVISGDTILHLINSHRDKYIYVFIKQNDILQVYKLQNRIQTIVDGLVKKIILQINYKDKQLYFKPLIYIQDVENAKENVNLSLFQKDLQWTQLNHNINDFAPINTDQLKILLQFPDIQVSNVYTLEIIVRNEIQNLQDMFFTESMESIDKVQIPQEFQQCNYILYLQTDVLTKNIIQQGNLQSSLELKLQPQLYQYTLILEVKKDNAIHVFTLISTNIIRASTNRINKYYIKHNNQLHILVIDHKKNKVFIEQFGTTVAEYDRRYLTVVIADVQSNKVMLKHPFKDEQTIITENINDVFKIIDDISGTYHDFNDKRQKLNMQYVYSYQLLDNQLNVYIDKQFQYIKQGCQHGIIQKIQRGSDKVVTINSPYQLTEFDLGYHFVYQKKCSDNSIEINLFQFTQAENFNTDTYNIQDYLNQSIITRKHDIQFSLDQDQYIIQIKEPDRGIEIQINDLFELSVYQYSDGLVLHNNQSKQEIQIIPLDKHQLVILFILFQQVLPGLLYN